MNAEIGARYDIEKMLNWSFNRGDLRGWGTIVGTWGGFDVSGLVGEANDGGNDYAFQLNGVQQAAALAPGFDAACTFSAASRSRRFLCHTGHIIFTAKNTCSSTAPSTSAVVSFLKK